jgi:DNA-binding NarL/FixJ family response regulator
VTRENAGVTSDTARPELEPTRTRPRVLLCDDHQLLRQAVRRALEDAGMEVVAEAADGSEAVRLAADVMPDVIVMDVSMPVLDGVEATRRIHADAPDLPIVVLTMHGEESQRRDALAAGATGFLTKDVAMQDVVRTVYQAAGGDVALSPELASTILSELRAPDATRASPLTPREEEVLQHIADGLSTSEVAERLFISGKTVKNHLASIYEKLDARDRTQAVLAAVRIGIIRLR